MPEIGPSNTNGQSLIGVAIGLAMFAAGGWLCDQGHGWGLILAAIGAFVATASTGNPIED